MIAKELLKRKKPTLAALGPGVEIGQFLGKTFLKRRRNKRKKKKNVYDLILFCTHLKGMESYAKVI